MLGVLLLQSSCGGRDDEGVLPCLGFSGALGFEYFHHDLAPAELRVLRQGPPSPAELDEILRMGESAYVAGFVSGRLELVHSEHLLRSKAGIDDTTMRAGLREVAVKRFASYRELRQNWKQALKVRSPDTPGHCLTTWNRCVAELTPEWDRIDSHYSEVIKSSIGLMSRPNPRSLDEIDLISRYPE